MQSAARTRTPFLRAAPYPVDPDAQAALDDAVKWLCLKARIDQIYTDHPNCFTQRSRAVHDLILHRIGQAFKDEAEVNLAVHCHWEVASFALQVNRKIGQHEAAADAVIPMSARRNLERDGAL